MTKKCRGCGKELPISDFWLVNKKGRPYRFHLCKACNNKRSADYRRKQNFGVSTEQFNALLIQQDSRCAICGRHQSECRRAFSVDHDHSTGKVRGLLCGECNMGLGKFKDDINLLNKAQEYIRSNQ